MIRFLALISAIKTSKGAVLLALSMIVCSSSYGQLSQPNRFEKTQTIYSNQFHIISLKEQGLALVREKEESKEYKKIWEIILLDSTLSQTWMSDIHLENRYHFIGYEYSQDIVYLLFRTGETEAEFLHLVSVNLINHEMLKYDIKHQFNLRLTHFSVAGGHALFGGYVVREPAVLLYEMATNQVKVVPGFFLNDTELLDLRVNLNHTFNAVLMERGKRDKKKLIVKTFDETGTLILEDEIELEQNKTVIAAQTSTLKRDELMVLGTFGEPNSKQAIGIFSVTIDPFDQQAIHYFDFAQFDHVLDYMSAKKISKVKAKAQRTREAGKIPDLRMYIQPFRLEECEDGFILLSEIYQPTSSSSYSPYWNSYYNPYGYAYPYGFGNPASRYYSTPYPYNNRSQTNDYRVLETVVTLFDAQGKLVWDHSLKIPDIHQQSLEQLGDFVFFKDRTLIAYKKEDEIISKLQFTHDPDIEGDTVKIQLNNPSDELRHDTKYEGTVRYWYGTNMFVWGYQTIRDRAKHDDQVRHVFYVNKIKVE